MNVVALFWLLLLHADFPGAIAQHGILSPSGNPFDGGEVGTCETPTVTACSGIVDYPVPTSIARLTPILEDIITKSLSPFSGACGETYKAVQCRLRFPRCLLFQVGTVSHYVQVDLNRQNCSDLLSACPSGTGAALENICNSLTQITVPSEGCTPLSQRNYKFEFCNFNSSGDFLVTEWIFQLMRFEDQRAGGFIYEHAVCGEGLANFVCNTMGRCTSSGQEIVYTNTHESCNTAVNW